jgi:hypothetical protein
VLTIRCSPTGDDLDRRDLRDKRAIGARDRRHGCHRARGLGVQHSGTIARVLGKTGINVMTRLMGLILAALAVEVMADGLVKLFPVLGSHLAR